MRKILHILGLLAALSTFVCAQAELSSVRQIDQLAPAQIQQGTPVEINGVVTFYEPAEHILFVNDSTGGIFVRTRHMFSFSPGDRVHVHGVTARSYRAVIVSEDIQIIGKAPLPRPSLATFPGLMSGMWDCSYVTVQGTVLSATIQQTIGAPFLLLEVLMDGGTIDVHVENPQTMDLRSLLDSKIELTGVSGGRFDGKFQLVGANLYLSSPAQMRITAPARTDIDTLALTPMDRVIGSYNILERSRRVRILGSVTLYEPGSQLVIENAGKAVLVHTRQNNPLNIGDVVSATGFADTRDYSQSLNHGQFSRTQQTDIIPPQPVTWAGAFSGKHPFDLISIEGRLLEQVRESNQGTLFINSNGHIFSAVLRHPGGVGPWLPTIPVGSTVRVSGVCFVASGGPWNGPLEFELHLRNPADVQVRALPSWWTVTHLFFLIGALGVLVLGALVWGALLRRRVHRQTQLIRHSMERESTRERRQANLEKERSRVLEAINSRLPLEEVLKMITGLISEQADGLKCWCEVKASGAGASSREDSVAPASQPGPRESRRDLLSGDGERLGSLVLTWKAGEHHPVRPELLDMGASLAALAIDNRRLYEGLVLRSHYDQLTEVPNRFLLETRLSEAFANAQLLGHSLALIYIDLDRFKSVNDRYGHRIGDMYLQNTARRLLEKLREQDTLARVGGDEFIVLIPVVRGRSEADEIAGRLTHCFDSPFRIDAHTIEGSASIGVAIYPEDGDDEDQLQRVADSAMYARKQRVLEWE
ncbi:MAG TPA: GGDEF domain-containing protein [Silvibacterium sp.]|nr:GGDEF domain-containing protein [Silvibacterium sp.]